MLRRAPGAAGAGPATAPAAVSTARRGARARARVAYAGGGAAPLVGRRDLYEGCAGDDVKALQRELAAGRYLDLVDPEAGFGVYTRATARAVRFWQADRGLPATGELLRGSPAMRVFMATSRADAAAPSVPVAAVVPAAAANTAGLPGLPAVALAVGCLAAAVGNLFARGGERVPGGDGEALLVSPVTQPRSPVRLPRGGVRLPPFPSRAKPLHAQLGLAESGHGGRAGGSPPPGQGRGEGPAGGPHAPRGPFGGAAKVGGAARVGAAEVASYAPAPAAALGGAQVAVREPAAAPTAVAKPARATKATKAVPTAEAPVATQPKAVRAVKRKAKPGIFGWKGDDNAAPEPAAVDGSVLQRQLLRLEQGVHAALQHRQQLEDLQRQLTALQQGGSGGAAAGKPSLPEAPSAAKDTVTTQDIDARLGMAVFPLQAQTAELDRKVEDGLQALRAVEAQLQGRAAAAPGLAPAPGAEVERLEAALTKAVTANTESYRALNARVQELEAGLGANLGALRAPAAPGKPPPAPAPLKEFQRALADIEQRFKKLESTTASAAGGALGDKVAQVWAKLAGLEEQLGRVEEAAAARPFEKRLAYLEAKVEALEGSVAATDSKIARFGSLSDKLAELERLFRGQPAKEKATSAAVVEAPEPEVAEPEVAEPEAPELLPAPERLQPEKKPLWRLEAGEEVLLQGFHWESCNNDWYRIVKERVPQIAAAGFTGVWLPPPSNSIAPQGYLPCDLYDLDSKYGSGEDLKDLLATIHEHGMHAIADIVINHRCANARGSGNAWNRWEGQRMAWDERAITTDNRAFQGQGNPGSGDDFHAAPNLDHSQEFVREDLKEWMGWLTDEVGFDSLRFDFTKGYAGNYVGEYIEACGPEFAVGEFWDALAYGEGGLEYDQGGHRQRTIDWVDRTGGRSAAFDFTTKGILQDACAHGELWRLIDASGKPPGVLGHWPSHAVTFTDNHDTGSTQAHWPFQSSKILWGYAYILTHPGTPCVFWDHVFDWGPNVSAELLALVKARQDAGVTSRSPVKIIKAESGLYCARVTGKAAELFMKIGDRDWSPRTSGFPAGEVAASGPGYAVWLADAASA